MGGKHKQAQRTKNNVRPSSSSRSAELLGSMAPTFVGFSTGRDGGVLPVLPGLSIKEDFDSSIDPNFQVVFKKMAKKDSTTKIKALNEFITLVNASEEALVCATLSFWPRHYSQLSMEVEHRVREAAQMAHGAVVRKCGRSVAPFLKQLAPVWLTSQYDTYVPAALQAQATLQSVFPSAKLPEVMSFCRVEILSFISENLIVHTPETLTNVKTSTPEEREAKYERVLIASLQGYVLFINNLPQSQLEWLCEEHAPILESKKFWSYGSHTTPQIRSGFHSVVGSMCQCLNKWFVPKYGKRSTEIIFSQLNDKDTTVTFSLWENAILIMANIPEWSSYIDVEKEVLPGICYILSAGGCNSAGRLAPLMLPLLAQFSTSPATQHMNNEFFDCILKGLEQRCVISSKSECTAWLKGLSECLRYTSVGAITSESVNTLSRILRSWLNVAAKAHVCINPLMPLKISSSHLSELAQFWTKQSLSPDNPNAQLYSQLIRLFWQNVQYILMTQIDSLPVEEEKIKEITDVQRELLVGLKSGKQTRCKKMSRVKFDSSLDGDDSVDSAAGKLDEASLSAKQTGESVQQAYDHKLKSLAYEVCAKYMKYAKTKVVSTPILAPLYTLILDFESADLYTSMVKILGTEMTLTKIVDLYTDILFVWLRGDAMRSQSIVDITFSIFKHLTEADKKEVLKSFDQLPLSIIKWCIGRCLSHPHSSCPAIRVWLQGPTVHQSLIAMTNLVVKEGDRHHATLIKMCFAQDNNGDILISDDTCSAVLTILSKSLEEIDSVNLDMCASFASQLAASVNAEGNIKALKDLALSQFKLNCNVQGGSDMLSTDTWWEVNTSWQDTLPTLSWIDRLWFTQNASDIMYGKLLNNGESSFDLKTIDEYLDLSYNIISSCVSDECENETMYKILPIIVKLDSAEVNSWVESIKPLSLTADVIRGKLDCYYIPESSNLKEIVQNDKEAISSDEATDLLRKLGRWSLFCGKLVDKIISKDSETNDDMEESAKGWISEISSSAQTRNIITELVHNTAMVQTLYNEYPSWSWFSTIQELYTAMECVVTHLVNALSKEEYNIIVQSVEEKANSEGLYWSSCLYMMKHTLRTCDNKNKNTSILKSALDDFGGKINIFNDLPTVASQHALIQSIQIICNEDPKATSDLKMKAAALLALKTIYFTHCTQETSKICVTKDNVLSCLTAPEKSLTMVVDTYYQYKSLMLYDMDFAACDWQQVECNASIVRFLISSIETMGWELESQNWDFITISLSSLVQSMDKSKHSWNTTKFALLACPVLELLCDVEKFIRNIPNECTRHTPSAVIGNLPQEWTDIFAPEIYKHLLEVFIRVCRYASSSAKIYSKNIQFLTLLREAMQTFDVKYIPIEQISMTSLASECYEVMLEPTHHIPKYMVHDLLKKFITYFIEQDKKSVSPPQEDEEATEETCQVPEIILSIHAMIPSLVQMQKSIKTLLPEKDEAKDEYHVFEPHSVGYSMSLSYFLVWDILLDITKDAVSVMQHQYTELLREWSLVNFLMDILCYILLPNLGEQSSSLMVTNYFKSSVNLPSRGPLAWSLLESLSFSCFVGALSGGVACPLARGWWGALPAKASLHVEQIVKTHISPVLIKGQLAEVGRRQGEISGLKASIHMSVNELVCEYTIDDTRMEISIKLSANHPLNIPKVVSNSSLISPSPWIVMFLSYQNGTLWKAICFWVNSLQRKFETTPVCYVCYSKLHATRGNRAKVTCPTCSNKFHSPCIVKWFNMSTKRTCPLCRNIM